jgi:hypothetical protein
LSPTAKGEKQGFWAMHKTIVSLVGISLFLFATASSADAAKDGVSRCVDDYGAVGDGVADDTRAIQETISSGHDGVWCQPIRVVFSPGRTYRVTNQIIAWAGVHLETDVRNPATILLKANTLGFGDPTKPRPMIMSRLSSLRLDCPDYPANIGTMDTIHHYIAKKNPLPGWPWRWPEDYDTAEFDQQSVHPACGPGNNFWSQIRNLKFRVEQGNPGAMCVYYNNAQGSFLYNLQFDLADDTFCGIYGGPVIVNCTFRGGRFGSYDISELGMSFNCHYSKQKEAAHGMYLYGNRMFMGITCEDVPVGIAIVYVRALTALNCTFTRCGVGIAMGNPGARVLLQNIKTTDTPVLFRSAKALLPGNAQGTFTLPTYVFGPVFDNGRWVQTGGVFPSNSVLPTQLSFPGSFDLSQAANVREFGAVGDGQADDTEAIRKAIAASETVFLPAGRYRVSDTILLRSQTKLIGEHILATWIVMAPQQAGFTDAKNPQPVVDTPDDPKADVHITQLAMHAVGQGLQGLDGAVGLRWRVGRKSSLTNCQLNLGGNPILVTGSGGGTFLNLWTAEGGLNKGLVVDHNTEPLLIFNLSSEHQTDKAVQLIGARDVCFYYGGGGEGSYPQEKVINEMADCDRIAWIYQVVHPEDNVIDTILKLKNCRNIWVGPLVRIHEEPVQHTVLDEQPDGKVYDAKNANFTLYRWGELNDLNRAATASGPDWRVTTPALLAAPADAAQAKPYIQGLRRPARDDKQLHWKTLSPQLPLPNEANLLLHTYMVNILDQPALFTFKGAAPAALYVDGVEVKLAADKGLLKTQLDLKSGYRSVTILTDEKSTGQRIGLSITRPDGTPLGGLFQLDPPPRTQPLLARFDPQGHRVKADWLPAADFAGGKIRLVRNDEHYPATPEDGKTVYEGTDGTFQDAYESGRFSSYYSLFEIDSTGKASPPSPHRVDLTLAPYIKSFLACGPFDAPDATDLGYEKAYFDEAAAAPAVKALSDEKPWTLVPGHAFFYHIVKVNKIFQAAPAGATPKVAYLATYVHVESDVKGLLLIQADQGCKAYLNGKCVGGGPIVIEGKYPQMLQLPVELKKGSNLLMLKVPQGKQEWEISVRIAMDRFGRLLPVPLTFSTQTDLP